MQPCPDKSIKCVNCHEYFKELRPLIKEVIVSHHFKKDAPLFDTTLITDCKHEYFVRLHKFEETIDGNHVFRAVKGKVHIVYVIDKDHRLIFLRAFKNFTDYKKFLKDKKRIKEMILSV